MRTTIEFDPDVAAELSRRRRDSGRTLRQDVNGLVRLGLAHESARLESTRTRFSTPTFDSGRPLVSVDDVEGALAQAEGEAHR